MDDERQEANDRVRLSHMLLAAQDALYFVQGRHRNDLEIDRLLLRGLTNCVQEIGEAANRISPSGRGRIPLLPWGQIIGMRNILVHAYFSVDADALWRVIQDDLPILVEQIRQALTDWPQPRDDSAS